MVEFMNSFNIQLNIVTSMPPKKQEEQAQNLPYKPIVVLPIFAKGSLAYQALLKAVNIKKNIDTTKIIQLLKDKGIDNHKNQQSGQISQSGRKFICQNMKFILEEFINQVKKPPIDQKKDPKKDNKKDAKKEEQPLDELEKPLQISFAKDCSDFYFLLDFPQTQTQLSTVLSTGFSIDIVIVIKQHILQSSRKPDYSLLGRQQNLQDFAIQMNKTSQQTNIDINKSQKEGKTYKKMLQVLKNYRRRSGENILTDCVIIQIPFHKNLQSPEKDSETFLNQIFIKICELTLAKNTYKTWKQNVKLVPMIEPKRQTVRKQVQIEDKKEDKKGAKKDTKAQVKVQIVEQIVQTPYQSILSNRMSNLSTFKKIYEIKKNSDQPIIQNILTCLVNAIDEQALQKKPLKAQQIFEISQNIFGKYENNPKNKIQPQNYQHNLRKIKYPSDDSIKSKLKISFPLISTDISFNEIKYVAKTNIKNLKIEYLISKFQELAQRQQGKFKWNFRDRNYIQKLTQDRLWGLVNAEVYENDPRILRCELKEDKIKLLVLAQINPPGRVLYNKTKFDEKVPSNFQQWFLENSNQKKQQYFNYNYQSCGNLSIISTNMMPTDNAIIRNQTYNINDFTENLIRINLPNNILGMKKIGQQSCFWLKNNSIKMYIKALKPQNVAAWIVKEDYQVNFDPYPTIFYFKQVNEEKRTIDCKGNITKYLKDGRIIIYFSNGDTSEYQYGKWNKIKDNKLESGIQLEMTSYLQGQKKIKTRSDNTVFVNLPNKDQIIIFPDGTQIYRNFKPFQIQIKNPYNCIVRITISQSSEKENIIGYGSPFAYLGFNNILERSCNGYLYQFFDNHFSTHLYVQKFEKNGKLQEEQITLINFQDSIIKLQGSGQAVFMQKKQMLGRAAGSSPILGDNETLSQRWLQLFTTIQNHKQGVYDISLVQASIKTKDSDPNQFKVQVSQTPDIKIAVSFKIDENQTQQEEVKTKYPNGFSIPQLNYFLPPPSNSIPPRLFSLCEGQYYEYLCQSQIPQIKGFHLQQKNNLIEMTYDKSKNQRLKTQFFTIPLNMDVFQDPHLLIPQKTQINLPNIQQHNVYHRIIQKTQWNKELNQIKQIQLNIRTAKTQRENYQKYFKK